MSMKSLLTGAALATSIAAPSFATEPVLYTPNPVPAYEAVQTVVKEKNGFTLGVITGGSGVLMRRIQAEGAAPQGDVFWSSSANTLAAFSDLFEAYSSPELNAIPAGLRYPGDLLLPTNVHLVTLLVNTDLLDGHAAPKTWADLADPAWKGKLIMPDPANSSTGYTIAWGMSKLLPPETFKAVVANTVISGSASAVPKGVAMGEYTVGMTFETNSYSYIDGGQRELSMVYPEDGTFETSEYAVLVKNAPAGKDAKALMDTVLSKDAQIALLENGFRRPSRSDIKVSDYVKLPELSAVKVFPVSEEDASKQRDAFLAEWAALPKAGDSK